MAPESLLTHNWISPKLDSWALGCFVVEVFSQRVPWFEVTELFSQRFLDMLQNGGGPRVEPEEDNPGDQGGRKSAIFRGVPSAALRQFCKLFFQVDPGERPSAAEAMWYCVNIFFRTELVSVTAGCSNELLCGRGLYVVHELSWGEELRGNHVNEFRGSYGQLWGK